MQYDRQIATAKRLIEKFGEACFWGQITEPAPADPTKPWLVADGVDLMQKTNIVFLPRNQKNTEFMQMLRPDLPIRTGKVYGLMAVRSFVPTMKDYVLRTDGSRYKITSIDSLNPNGQEILYTIYFDV